MTRTFMFAAVAALTLGSGAAMAQSQEPSSNQGAAYQWAKTQNSVRHEKAGVRAGLFCVSHQKKRSLPAVANGEARLRRTAVRRRFS